MVLIFLLIGLGFGMFQLRRKGLAGETTERIGSSTKTVSATVDGKPVRSYIMDKAQ